MPETKRFGMIEGMMNLKRFYLFWTVLALGLLIGSAFLIYSQGQSRVQFDLLSSQSRIQKSYDFLGFITNYRSGFQEAQMVRTEPARWQRYSFILPEQSTQLEDYQNAWSEYIESKDLIAKEIEEQRRRIVSASKVLSDELSAMMKVRVQEGEDFLPGVKNLLQEWGGNFEFIQRLRTRLDVAYVKHQDFDELQSLLILGSAVADFTSRSYPSEQDLTEGYLEVMKRLDQAVLGGEQKQKLRNVLRDFADAQEKKLRAENELDRLSLVHKKIIEHIDEFIRNSLLTSWQRFMVDEAEQSFKEQRRENRVILNALVLVTCGVLIILTFTFMRIFPYLSLLKKRAQEMRQGNYGHQFPQIPGDEIGEVMQAFDEMSKRLQNEERERMALHDQLTQTRRLSELEELTAKMSHELKNPVSILNFCLSDAEEALHAQRQQEAVSELAKAREALERVKGVLARMSEPGRGYKFERIDLRKVCSNLIQLYRPFCEIELEADGEEFPIWGLDFELQGAVANLIDNALEAQSSRSLKKVKLCLQAKVDEVELSVANPGEAIAGADKLFHGFHSTKQGALRGLGLSIVKEVVELCRGTITYDYRNGEVIFLARFPTIKSDDLLS